MCCFYNIFCFLKHWLIDLIRLRVTEFCNYWWLVLVVLSPLLVLEGGVGRVGFS